MSEGTLISTKPKRTIKDGAQRWVSEFNQIPTSLLAKLLQHNPEEFTEITPPSLYDTVTAYKQERTEPRRRSDSRSENRRGRGQSVNRTRMMLF
jgi:hypothetical protein